jgi:hypothetical protein
MKQSEQAIEWARRAIVIASNHSFVYGDIIAALALIGHDADAHEAPPRFLRCALSNETLTVSGPCRSQQ